MINFLSLPNGYPLLYIFWYLLLLFVVLDMVNRRRDPTVMLSWFVILITLPYFGVLLYLLISRRKIVDTPFKINFAKAFLENTTTFQPLEKMLNRYGIPQATHNNRFDLISDGSEAYHTLIDQVNQAQHAIYLATYIFDQDSVTEALSKLLIKKAQEGVDVRLLIDAYGSLKLYLWSKPLQPIYDAGVKVAFFMPLRPWGLNTHFNLRLHRKIYLFDHHTLLSGGINLSQTYLNPQKYAPQRWDDLLFMIQGSAVTHYRDVFLSDWNFTVDRREIVTPIPPPSHPLGEERIQVVPSGPDIESDAIYDGLINALYEAKERIWIVSPYFIPNSSIMEALRIARGKGVNVKLITPKHADNILFDIARSSYLHEIHEWGGEVALYHKNMLHAKALLIDRSSVIVGSLNFDNRSFFLNYEIVSVGYSAGIIDKIEKWMIELLDNATLGIQSVGRIRKILENLGRIIAPQI